MARYRFTVRVENYEHYEIDIPEDILVESKEDNMEIALQHFYDETDWNPYLTDVDSMESDIVEIERIDQ
jgi:hypothetical protein